MPLPVYFLVVELLICNDERYMTEEIRLLTQRSEKGQSLYLARLSLAQRPPSKALAANLDMRIGCRNPAVEQVPSQFECLLRRVAFQPDSRLGVTSVIQMEPRLRRIGRSDQRQCSRRIDLRVQVNMNTDVVA